MSALVRPATLADTWQIAAIHREAFPRQRESATWVKATLSAVPRMLSFVLILNGGLVGYIFWAQKSGIRPVAILEMDQVAVAARFQRQGNGALLIRESLALVVAELRDKGQSVKSVLVSTRADSQASRLYVRVLGAKVIASLEGLYSATEVLMLAEVAGA